MFNIHLQRLLYTCCPAHSRVKSSPYTGAEKATVTSCLRLGRSEVLRSLRHCPLAQSQGSHTIGRLKRRGVQEAFDDLPWKDVLDHYKSDQHGNSFKGNIEDISGSVLKRIYGHSWARIGWGALCLTSIGKCFSHRDSRVWSWQSSSLSHHHLSINRGGSLGHHRWVHN